MKMYRPHRLYPRNSKPKEPSLYRSLCVSILCMFLSTVMLVGTTMAWFSDSLQTGVYTITSADFSTTVYYCTDLSNANNTPNNWQRLNPGNTTLFGGGSLSSKVDQAGQDGQRSQVAYLKLVNNSNIPLKYKFTLANPDESSNIDSLSLAGCQTKTENGESVALSESDLKTINLSAITPGSDSKTVVFDVPAATDGNNPSIVYAVLKLTYTTPSDGTSTSSNIFRFALKVAVTQTGNGAGETASNSLPTPSTEVTIETGSTLPTVSNAAIGGGGEITSSVGENNSDTNNTETLTPETPTPETPANSPAEAESSAGPTETDTPSNVITTPSNGENLS